MKIDSELSDTLDIKKVGNVEFEELDESIDGTTQSALDKVLERKQREEEANKINEPQSIKINNFDTINMVKQSVASATPTQNTNPNIKNNVQQNIPITNVVKENAVDIQNTQQNNINDSTKSPYLIPLYDYDKHCTINVDAKWQTIAFPSNGLYYKPKLQVRALRSTQLPFLATSMSREDFTAFLNILDNNIEIPIRQLTQDDFGFFIRWLKFNSYPLTPVTFTWWSRYDNKNVTTLNDTALEFIKCDALEKHPDKVEKYKQYKMTCPRVADLEFEQTAKLSEEDTWLLQYAQYFEGSTWEEKLNNIDNVDDFSALIREFKEVMLHGCEEYVYVRDIHFEPAKYISDLESRLELLRGYNEELQKKTLTSLGYQTELEESYNIIGALTAELVQLKSKPLDSIVAEEEKKLLPFRPYVLLPEVQLESRPE